MAHAWKACWVKALGGSNPPSSAGDGPVTCSDVGGGPFVISGSVGRRDAVAVLVAVRGESLRPRCLVAHQDYKWRRACTANRGTPLLASWSSTSSTARVGWA